MSTLKNARHERFAQELAGGKNASEAYAIAGYSPNRHNASVLKQTKTVSNRLNELLTARDEMDRQATQMAVEALAIDKAWIMARLVKNAVQSLGEEPVKLKIIPKGMTEPVEVEVTMHDAASANRSLELLGKELGMFIDRKEVRTQVTLEQMIIASYNRGGRSEEPVLIEGRVEENEASK